MAPDAEPEELQVELEQELREKQNDSPWQQTNKVTDHKTDEMDINFFPVYTDMPWNMYRSEC